MKRLLGVLFFSLLCVASPHQSWSAVQSQTVTYQDGTVELKGYLAWNDKIKGKRPGVLVVHEWWGINDYARKRARMLAKAGYVAMAIDMYGKAQNTKHGATAKAWMRQITKNVSMWRQRALAGLEQLRNHPRVDPHHIAAIGYCFGGATVMQLAYDPKTDLDGVVSFHGSLPVLDSPKPGAVKPSVLVYHGHADKFVPRRRILSFTSALEKAEADWRMVTFGGARHSFTNPDSDALNMPGLGYHRRADQLSWSGMLGFLKEIFSR
ncbi:MAG: dienelactone hydrolase family protein [Magnetococcales bacterium]|nr:dienelactone hydrolase family protein [Magnetococcales bacterium]